MSRLDFHFEFDRKMPSVDDSLVAEAESRLRALAEGHSDMVGAAVVVEELAHDETPHICRARVVAYIRPDNIVGVEKADSPNLALHEALKAVERQVRQQREKFRERWAQPELVTDLGVYELSAHEIYQTFVEDEADPAEVLAMERTDVATQLMTDHNLEEVAAFYAADQIFVAAQEIIDEVEEG